jgi:predicted transcriptional regulator
MQFDLDLPSDNFKLVRIGPEDARVRNDDFLLLREQILQNEEAYPNIGRWFDAKVTSGLRTGERSGFVGLINEKAVAAAILRRGSVSKFCHLKISESVRSRSLGDLFFTLMTLEVRHCSRSVRFTLPESVWEDRKSFFQGFSFNSALRCGRQYRLFDTELYSETSFNDLFQASKDKLPKLLGQLAIGNHSLLTGAVLALQPSHLEKVLSGVKTVEIRTRFSDRWEGRRISLYGTRPISGIAGEATVSRVIPGQPDRIWEHFGHLMGCTKVEYDEYVGVRSQVHALILRDVREFPFRIPLSQLSHLLGVDLPAPQSYVSLENNQEWLAAVTLAAALQGSICVRKPPTPVSVRNSSAA